MNHELRGEIVDIPEQGRDLTLATLREDGASGEPSGAVNPNRSGPPFALIPDPVAGGGWRPD